MASGKKERLSNGLKFYKNSKYISALDEAVWEEERREYVQMFRDDADEVVPRALQEGYPAKLVLTPS